MPRNAWLASTLFSLAAIVSQAEPASGPAGEKAQAQETGYTVTVEFDVDSAGTVTNARVVASEWKQLDEFALGAANSGQLSPGELPAVGSGPKHVKAPVF